MEPRVPVTIEARLSYRNKGDAPDDWKLYANSTESRTMDCSPPTVSHKLYSHLFDNVKHPQKSIIN